MAARPAFAVGQGSDRFELSSVSDLFPSSGFEDQVEFWRAIFARHEQNDVTFHDATDLRLVYAVEKIGASAEPTPEEAEKQLKQIRKRRDEYKKIFDGIIRRGADSSGLTPLQKKIVDVLKKHDYSTSAAGVRQRRDNLRSQRGIRAKFLAGLIRSGRYLTYIQERFRQAGLPAELAALPHIESSFDYKAYSGAGAAGIWQFTRATGRSYLRVNSVIDERLDPLRATQAAARVLSDNYNSLSSWPLALTAYNYGKYGMLRAQKRHGSDLKQIIENYKTRTFGFASKNFYAEFLAALEISRNASHYFGDFQMEPPMRYETVRLTRAVDPVHLTADGQFPMEQLADYNPHLRTLSGRRTRPIPAGARVRVPVRMASLVKEAVDSAPAAATGLTVAADGSLYYRVERGDSLGRIAAQFQTSVSRLKSLNGLRNSNLIYPGQRLMVGASSSTDSDRLAAIGDSRPSSYRVRRGDTLSSIAGRFGLTPGALQQANRLGNPNRIAVGQRLSIPGSPAAATSYQIRRGDTLTKIARRFNTSVQNLKEVNSISNANRLLPGQRLIIPQTASRQ